MYDIDIALTYPREDGKFPIGIKYTPGVDKPIYLWEGYSWMLNGIRLSAAEAIQPQWRKHIREANADWFIPFLEQLALGKDVNLNEFIEKHKK